VGPLEATIQKQPFPCFCHFWASWSDEDVDAVASGTSLGKASFDRDGVRSLRRGWVEIIGPGQAAKNCRLAARRSAVRKVRVSEFFIALFRRKENLTKPQAEFGITQKYIDEGAIIILE